MATLSNVSIRVYSQKVILLLPQKKICFCCRTTLRNVNDQLFFPEGKLDVFWLCSKWRHFQMSPLEGIAKRRRASTKKKILCTTPVTKNIGFAEMCSFSFGYVQNGDISNVAMTGYSQK
jgi:hypothetical protein